MHSALDKLNVNRDLLKQNNSQSEINEFDVAAMPSGRRLTTDGPSNEASPDQPNVNDQIEAGKIE